MSKLGYRRVGKPELVPDGNNELQLQPVVLDSGDVKIQWGAVSTFSPTFLHWQRYKRCKKSFETAREAREFIRSFARAEQERVTNANDISQHGGSGTS